MISASSDINKSCKLLWAYSAFCAHVSVEYVTSKLFSPTEAYESLAQSINCYSQDDNGEHAIIFPHANSRMETHFPWERVEVPFAALAKVRAEAKLAS